MSDLTLYGLKNCDTCKKALTALEAAGRDITFVDIRAEADLSALIPGWIEALGPEPLVNKRSTTWRGLGDADKAAALAGGTLESLQAHPTLIKRPVIVDTKGGITVGWTPATEKQRLSA